MNAPMALHQPFQMMQQQQPTTSSGEGTKEVKCKMANEYPPILSNPRMWNCGELAKWLRDAGFGEMAGRLLEEVWPIKI